MNQVNSGEMMESNKDFYLRKLKEHREGWDVFNDVWERMERLVFRTLAKYFPNEAHDSQVFESALQDARLTVWGCIDKFDLSAKTQFDTYAIRAVTNRVLSDFRYNSWYTNRHEFPDDTDLISLNTFWNKVFAQKTWSWVPEAEADIVYNDLCNRLQRKLSGVPLEIANRLIEGLSLREVKKVLCKELELSGYKWNKQLKSLRNQVTSILEEPIAEFSG